MAPLTSDAAPGPGPSPAQTRAWLPRPHGNFAAWAALLTVWVVWGSTYLAIRVADRSIPPFAMAATRYLAAGAVLYPLAVLGARRRRSAGPNPAGPPPAGPNPAGQRSWSRRAQWGGMAVVGTMLLAFGNGGVSYAEETLPSGLAALLVASVPLWMVLADRVINGQRIPLLGWLALVTGMAGIAVLARPSGGAVLPVLVVLGASVSWGVGSVLAGRLPAPASPLVGSAMEMLAGGVVLTGLAAATGELTRVHPGQVSTQSLLGLLYLIGPGSLLALTCYVIALRRLPTAVVSTYAYVNPVVAVSLGALFLGERPTLATLLGGAVVVAAVALLLLRRPRPAEAGEPAEAVEPAVSVEPAELTGRAAVTRRRLTGATWKTTAQMTMIPPATVAADGCSMPASQTQSGPRTFSSWEISATSAAGISRAPRVRNSRPRPIWTTPSSARYSRLVPPISLTWANGANAASTRSCERHVAGAIDTSDRCRATTIVAANVSMVISENTVPASPGRVGAPAITAKPATATPIAAQVRGRTGSPARRPSSAAASGTSAWMTRTLATEVSCSAVTNEPDETAISAAIDNPGRPVARKARTSWPRSATATNTRTATKANAARPASCEARFRCSWRCRIPASDHISAASAM
jgi:drug/metabolite transporter (DMT)-like permease